MTNCIPAGELLAFRNDRLGARIMCVLNAMRLHRDHDLPFRVHWHQGTDIGRVFNDTAQLFDQDFIETHFIDRDTFRSRVVTPVRFNNLKDATTRGLRDLLASGQDVLLDQPFGYTVLADESEDTVARRCHEIWANFPFAKTLQPKIEELTRNLRGATAYHIRRGDIISFPRAMNRSWPKKYIPDDYFVAHMQKLLATGIRPVLFSDDQPTIDRFQGMFPDLIAANSLFDANIIPEGQRDLLELVAMSRCDKIIAPPGSAFSSTAAALGGCRKLDVMEDLTPTDVQASRKRMQDRMKAAAAARDIRDAGDLGQTLQHVANDLAVEGRFRDAAAIIAPLVTAGLNISFLYPLLLEMQLASDDHDGALRVADLMQDRVLFHRQDWAASQALIAHAWHVKGNRQRAATAALNAYWHHPDHAYVHETISAFNALGYFDDTAFPPLGLGAHSVRNRTTPQLLTHPAFARVRKELTAADLTRKPLRGFDTMIWDWFPMLRGFNPKHLENHKQRARYEQSFAKLMKQNPTADLHSLRILFLHMLGKHPAAEADLASLAVENAQNAMIWHRLSLVQWIARDFNKALKTAETASDADGHPAHIAWRGLLRFHARDFSGCCKDLQSAISAGFCVPNVYLTLAQAQQRLKQTNAACITLANAIAVSPREQEPRFARARIMLDRGDHASAIKDLDVLLDIDGRSPKVLALHAECLAATGDIDRAIALLDLGLAHAPDAPKLTQARHALSKVVTDE